MRKISQAPEPPFPVALGFALAAAVLLAGCEQKPRAAVVVYTSVDQQFAEQILRRFEQQAGIRVEALFDSEAGKTTGFLRRLAREAEQPRCDVWWSSEIFGTIELARAGVLEPCTSPAAADVPGEWKDAQGFWIATAARARVFAFRRDAAPPEAWPASWRDLAQPQWASKLAIANPQFGTTRGHLAAMFAYWGADAGREFLRGLQQHGATLADGNGQAARMVATGDVAYCLTDTDDVWVLQGRGEPLDVRYLPLEPGGHPVWIPCTVGRVRGGPNPQAAQKLIDFLVSAEVERLLAESDSRNVPVRPALRREILPDAPEPRALDFNRVADALPAAMDAARSILLR